jgi:hypothetical protein
VFIHSQEHPMGITLLSFSGLFAPLQQLAGWFADSAVRSPQPATVRVAQSPPLMRAGRRGSPSWRPALRSAPLARRPLQVVRVVRVMDDCTATACAGRMLISGRMADVCAELDRLAASEAGQPR